MSTWRLIVDGARDGASNMGVDRALLESHADGGPPTLRLYRWAPATVSLGRFQKLQDVDRAACAEAGLGVCRRPTGGRGVLHADELTYSIVAGTRDGLPRGVNACYRLLCGALVEAYRELGVPADLTPRERGVASSAACYLHATAADLSLGAAKLSGSAQVWHKDSCLQHGSFVISRDLALEARVFRLDERGRDALASHTRTLAEALGSRPADDHLQAAIVRGLSRGLAVSLEQGELSAREAETASMRAEGYALE